MDQLGSQQAWGYPALTLDQQNNLGVEYNRGLESNHERNKTRYGQYIANLAAQDTHPQPHSNPESFSSLTLHYYSEYAATSSFRHALVIDLASNASNAGLQFPANGRRFEQDSLLWPQPDPITEPDSNLIPYGEMDHESSSTFGQAFTTGTVSAAQRLGQSRSRRCVRCWTLKKPVFLFP